MAQVTHQNLVKELHWDHITGGNSQSGKQSYSAMLSMHIIILELSLLTCKEHGMQCEPSKTHSNSITGCRGVYFKYIRGSKGSQSDSSNSGVAVNLHVAMIYYIPQME